MSEQNAKWYVLHTYSGYENIVKSNLLTAIENNGLEDRILDLQIPMEQAVEEKNGKKKVIMRKSMPCYVFIKLDYNNDLYSLITNTRGVTGFVGPAGRPVPLPDDEVQIMQLENHADNASFNLGDQITVVAGPLAGNMGVIISLNEEQQKAKINVEMFGRDAEVDVEFVQISKNS